MTEVHPVYIDGPLKGGDYPLDSSVLWLGRMVAPSPPYWWEDSEQDRDEDRVQPLRYIFNKFLLCGKIVIVASLHGPRDEDVFEALASDAAKKAVQHD